MTENIVSSIKIKKIKKNFTVCKVENMEKINFAVFWLYGGIKMEIKGVWFDFNGTMLFDSEL